MNIEPQEVNGTVKDYLKKGAMNVWQHQVVYLLPLFILLPMIGLISIAPGYTKNTLFLFTGMFFLFLYMEITFTTTQEKYTPTKYLESFMVAMYSMMNYFKRHSKLIGIYLLITIVANILFYISNTAQAPAVSTPATVSQIILQFIMGILRYSHTNSLGTIAILSYIFGEVISDYFVVERMTGLKNETPDNLMKSSIKYNKVFFLKIFAISSIFDVVAPIMLGFQFFAFIILVVAVTFHSMDIFNVNTGKKQKQIELEKNDVKNFVPTMTGA